MHTPTKMKKRDFALFILIKYETKEPVYAPVPGNGMATRRINPSQPYFSTTLFLDSIFVSNLSNHIQRKNPLLYLKGSRYGNRNTRRIAGIILPNIEIKNTLNHGKPAPTPVGMESLNSPTGVIANINTLINFIYKSIETFLFLSILHRMKP